jgi:3-mercaptopropionate dioxygenase
MPNDAVAPLRDFVGAMTRLTSRGVEEKTVLLEGKALLKDLVKTDTWLPEFCAQPHEEYYQQYLLHADPLERFSVVSFVWGPGQQTPIHDHCVWGLIGMLRGMESEQRYKRNEGDEWVKDGGEATLRPGEVQSISPSSGDIHRVRNANPGRLSISIHVYGGNIGAIRRHVFDPVTGSPKDFVSGYSSDRVPNLWDRSSQIREEIMLSRSLHGRLP